MPTTTFRDIVYIEAGQAAQDVVADNAFENLSRGVSGLVLLDVSGSSDVTLTDDSDVSQSKHALLDCTGVLTADIAVLVPAKSRRYLVRNRTTGAWTITVKTVSGTGVSLGRGQWIELACDGSNVALVHAAFPPTLTGLSTHTHLLTDTPVNLFRIALPDSAMTGGMVIATLRASDGTDSQVLTQMLTWAGVNTGGSYTLSVVITPEVEASALSTGTLTATWDLTAGTDEAIMSLTPAGSLTETAYLVSYCLINLTPREITLL